MKQIDRIIRESIYKIIKESIEGEFIPTVQWMKQKYDEFNSLYFDSVLPKCGLKIMSVDTNQLGTFHFSKKSNLNNVISTGNKNEKGEIGIFYNEKTGGYEHIDRNNIYKILEPVICMNVKFSVPVDEAENTLIHEMCHYWQIVVNGWWKREDNWHGDDFLEIAEQINAKSNGKVKITPTSDSLSDDSISDDWMSKRGQYALFATNGKNSGILLSKDDGMKNNIVTMASMTYIPKIWISYDPKLLSKLNMHYYSNRKNLTFSQLPPGFNFDDYKFIEVYDSEKNKSEAKNYLYFNPKAAAYIVSAEKRNGEKTLVVTTAQKSVERDFAILSWKILEKYTDPSVIDKLYREGYWPGNTFKKSLYSYSDEVYNIINNK